MPNGFEWNISYRRYEVTGSNLSEVSDQIFDVGLGRGFLSKDGQRRFAGKTEFDYSYQSAWEYDPKTKRLIVRVKKINWRCTIHTPQWQLQKMLSASDGEQGEWRRFLAALKKHELGHFELYHWGIRRVREALENKPAGSVTITVSKEPEYDKLGEPKTSEDREITEVMDKAVRQVITQHPTFVNMMAKQAKYDSPPTSPNPDPDSVFTSSDPDGTDHGKTQEATLRLP